MSSKNNQERTKKIQEALERKKAFGYPSTEINIKNTNPKIQNVSIQRPKKQSLEYARIPPLEKNSPINQKEMRPNKISLHRVNGTITKLSLPEGSFNGSMIRIGDKYLLVYRPTEFFFNAVYMDENFNIISGSQKSLDLKGLVADPRLIITPSKKVLVVYSKYNYYGNDDCIWGSIIVDLNISENIFEYEHFRISPVELNSRQKNWMPFVHENKIYLISDVSPHRIYEFDEINKTCILAFEHNYRHAWFNKNHLRGNTNCIRVDDNHYLSIFHTVQKIDNCDYYDNGAYLFLAKPPFTPVKFGNKTIMPAELASEKHFRKEGQIICIFPMSLHKDGDDLFITYGDNDSAVKILKTTLRDVIFTLVNI